MLKMCHITIVTRVFPTVAKLCWCVLVKYCYYYHHHPTTTATDTIAAATAKAGIV
jgi:hypothetical protein